MVSSACAMAGPGGATGAGQPVLRHLQVQRSCWLSPGVQAALSLLIPALEPRWPQGAATGGKSKPHWEQK